MCGISGFHSGQESAQLAVNKMLLKTTHRGPDAINSRFFSQDNLCFGHNRLSILDLESRSNQPFEFNGLTMVYNGEVYNYKELRVELEVKGYKFETTSDTEVVIKAFHYWGFDCFDKFNGMWALAIYNSITKKIILSRDHFGIKPLYYYKDNQRFIFGSEIKQLTAVLPKLNYNRNQVLSYLTLGFENFNFETFFEGIYEIPAGEVYEFDLKQKTISFIKKLKIQKAKIPKLINDVVEEFDFLLRKSIKLRQRSDVPITSCLSGGLDSSLVTYFMADQGTSENFDCALHVQSMELESDESHFAKSVASELNLDLTVVKPSSYDFIDKFSKVMVAQEEPFGSPSIFMGYNVFELAKSQGKKVVLNGQGADELFFGYERYFALMKSNNPIKLLKYAKDCSKKNKQSISYFVANQFYFRNFFIRKTMIQNRILSKLSITSLEEKFIFDQLAEQMQKYECSSELFQAELYKYQLPHLLRYEDRNSMAHSVEARLPFLDQDLVAFAHALPLELKIKQGWTKYIMRESAKTKLGQKIAWRKDKIGFESPTNTWLRDNEVFINDLVNESTIIVDFFKSKNIGQQLFNFSENFRWRIINLAAWEKFVQNA